MKLKKEIIDIIKLCDALPQEKKMALKREEDFIFTKMMRQYPGLIKKVDRVYGTYKIKITFVFGKSIGNYSKPAVQIANEATRKNVLVSLENNLSNPNYRNLAFILTYSDDDI